MFRSLLENDLTGALNYTTADGKIRLGKEAVTLAVTVGEEIDHFLMHIIR